MAIKHLLVLDQIEYEMYRTNVYLYGPYHKCQLNSF
jgi:hypothetical protein